MEPPAWYEPAYVDTQLTFSVGVAHFRGSPDATRFLVGLSPLRRGPLEFGGSLPYVFVRSPDGAAAGVGDPHVDGRLRLPFPRSWPVGFCLDASARLPMANDEVFPYATGAQHVEVSGTLSAPSLVHLFIGVGRIFAEPPRNGDLTRSDVPHSTHVWAACHAAHRAWWVATRGDLFLFDVDDEVRGIVKLTLGWRNPQAFVVTFDWSVDLGTQVNRVFDHGPTLRFATPLL